ncbi:MAG: hypothetical protein LWY06_07440 [Firmicutes bacterium]|nr:hypothetical protein [Bacillota bacterium]
MGKLGNLLGKSFSIINAFRITPGKMSAEMKKKFKLAVIGSPAPASNFFEAVTRNANMEVSAEEREAKLNEYIRVVPFPAELEVLAGLRTDLMFQVLSSEDVNDDNLEIYKELRRNNPRSMLFIEKPGDEDRQKDVNRILLHNFISDVNWVDDFSTDSITPFNETIIRAAGKYDLSMSYRFPIFREALASKLIHNTSVQNMIIALASSLPTNLPVVGIIIGLLAVAGETTVLTINQLKLCLQIAGLYEAEINVLDRIKELWPLVGAALGMRTIARSVVGFVPLAGPTLKGAIAYGGTYAVGETARWYYSQGVKLSEEEKQQVFHNARERAFSMAQKFIDKFKKPEELEAEQTQSMDFSSLEEGLKKLEHETNRIENLLDDHIEELNTLPLQEELQESKVEPEVVPPSVKTEVFTTVHDHEGHEEHENTPVDAEPAASGELKPVPLPETDDMPSDSSTKIIEEPAAPEKDEEEK